MSLIDDIRKALQGEKKSEFIDQILKEQAFYDALHKAGLTVTAADPTERGRLQPFGVLSKVQKIDLIDELTLLKTIETIQNIDLLKTIEEITRIKKILSIESAQIQINALRNSTFVNGFEGWINPSGSNITREADSLNQFEIAVKFDHAGCYLTQNLSVDSNKYPKLPFWAYKPAVGGADLRLRMSYVDGTVDNYIPALTNAWVCYAATLLPDKILKKVEFRDQTGICYLAMPMFVEGVPLYAWDGSAWKKVRCDANGYLITTTPP